MKNLKGKVFGRLTVLHLARPRQNKHGSFIWIVQCSCGSRRKKVNGNELRSGKTVSCGCQARENFHHRIHGHAPAGKATPEYRAWHGLRSRCLNPRSPKFSIYGARGIKICDRWKSFVLFLEDMGPRPSKKHSLDRVNANGNYSPENCRWATSKQQNRNRRNNHRIFFKGESLCLAEAAEKYDLNSRLIQRRIALGWSVEEALTIKPVAGFKRKRKDK